MDSIEPIHPIAPLYPVWPVRPAEHAGHFPGLRPQTDRHSSSPAASPEVGAPPVPEEDRSAAAPLTPPPRSLRETLLAAGVRGIGPVGSGFPLAEQELAVEVAYAYRHIAHSLRDVLPEQPTLPAELHAAATHDPRAGRELGLLLMAAPPIGQFLAPVLGTGELNRWQQEGQNLQAQLERHPASVIADLQLIESPDHRWQS